MTNIITSIASSVASIITDINLKEMYRDPNITVFANDYQPELQRTACERVVVNFK